MIKYLAFMFVLSGCGIAHVVVVHAGIVASLAYSTKNKIDKNEQNRVREREHKMGATK